MVKRLKLAKVLKVLNFSGDRRDTIFPGQQILLTSGS
jgi:hypothetical protein